MSGGSVPRLAANWPTGRTGNCTTSAFPMAMPSTKPPNHSGGPERQPGPASPHQGDAGHFFELQVFRAPCERAMTTLRFDDLRQYSDLLHARSGEDLTVRFVEPRDAEPLQNYFRSLTTR